jgi:hypothetical protein
MASVGKRLRSGHLNMFGASTNLGRYEPIHFVLIQVRHYTGIDWRHASRVSGQWRKRVTSDPEWAQVCRLRQWQDLLPSPAPALHLERQSCTCLMRSVRSLPSSVGRRESLITAGSVRHSRFQIGSATTNSLF